MKQFIKKVLKHLHLMRAFSAVFQNLNPRLKQEKQALKKLKSQIGKLFIEHRIDNIELNKKVLFVSVGTVNGVIMESVFLKAFEAIGYEPIILCDDSYLVRETYKTLGISNFVTWEDFQSKALNNISLNQINNFEDLLNFKVDGIAAGKYTASTLMRHTRLGNFMVDDPDIKGKLKLFFDQSILSVRCAQNMIDRIKPDAVVGLDRGYTPLGQLFDASVINNIPFYTWNAAHKNNALIYKRYDLNNCDQHPVSLSSKSWKKIKAMDWNDSLWQTLYREIEHCYLSGQWYSEVGTQFDKMTINKETLFHQLGLDPKKKTAIIFAHIFWDATFFWGTDLFKDYEEWFLETVKCAFKNKKLNWIIKIHPGNIVKNRREGITEECSEMQSIKKHFSQIPDHVKIIAADSDISTWSLYPLIDYCLTVRGTVGIEAACLGKTVLTAGTGRYDGLGFTNDSSNCRNYLEKLTKLDSIPLITDSQVELARKFAYGTFILRVQNLQAVKMAYQQDEYASLSCSLTVNTWEKFNQSKDVLSVVNWIKSNADDYLNTAF